MRVTINNVSRKCHVLSRTLKRFINKKGKPLNTVFGRIQKYSYGSLVFYMTDEHLKLIDQRVLISIREVLKSEKIDVRFWHTPFITCKKIGRYKIDTTVKPIIVHDDGSINVLGRSIELSNIHTDIIKIYT